MAFYSRIGAVLWALFTVMMLSFAIWVFFRKRPRPAPHSWSGSIIIPLMYVSGCLTLFLCTISSLMQEWPVLFLSNNRWFQLVFPGTIISLGMGWVVSEFSRWNSLLRDKDKSLLREKFLREELQQVYIRECDLHKRLQESYDEQQISIL